MGLKLATKFTTASGAEYIVDPIRRMWGYRRAAGVLFHEARLHTLKHTEGDPANEELVAAEWFDGKPSIGQRMQIGDGKMDGQWRTSTAIVEIEEVESPW